MMYGQDYDEMVFPYRIKNVTNPYVIQDPAHVTNTAAVRQFFNYLLSPYIKNDNIWRCPSNPKAWVNIDTSCDPAVGDDQQPTAVDDGCSYGGQNSYGINKYVFQPNGPTTFAAVSAPADTLVMTDTSYYNVLPRYTDDTGAQVISGILNGDPLAFDPKTDNGDDLYLWYYSQIGNSNWTKTADAATTAAVKAKGKSRHMGVMNCVFADGHAKAWNYDKLIDDLIQNPGNSIWDPYKAGMKPL